MSRAAPSGWLLIVLFAALLRLGILLAWSDRLRADHDLYLDIAENLVSGHGFSTSHGLLAYRPPLYPLCLAMLRVVPGGVWTIGLAHVALGVVTVYLTMSAARRMGLEQSSWIAGLVVACDPLLLNATVSLMTETLAACLAAAVLWCHAVDASRPTPLSRFALGTIYGLACLCRPTFWAFAVLSALGALIPNTRHQTRNTLVMRMMPIAGFLVIVSPWVIRNALVFGRPVLTTTHGGYTLLLAHNPVYYDHVQSQPLFTVWDGASLSAWQVDLERELAAHDPPLDLNRGRPPPELARDEWMSRRAWRTIADDPLMAARSGLSLVSRLWNVVPLGEQARRMPFVLRWGVGLFYIVLFLSAAAGLFRLPRDQWATWWPAISLLIAFTLVHTLYWSDMRMRAPLTPALALLAAHFWSAARSLRRAGPVMAPERRA